MAGETPTTPNYTGQTVTEATVNAAIVNAGNVVISGQEFQSVQEGLTAHAGGGQGSATPITAMVARFTTVATIADSAILPVAVAGLEITVINAASNSMNVFPDVGSTINALGANAAFALAGGKTVTFFTTKAGAWHGILSA